MNKTETSVEATKITLDTVVVELDNPINRGAQKIHKVTLRRPKAGSLRGLNLIDVAHLDVSSLVKLLPRISDPALTEHDINNMELADLTALGTEVAGFLAQKSMMADFQD